MCVGPLLKESLFGVFTFNLFYFCRVSLKQTGYFGYYGACTGEEPEPDPDMPDMMPDDEVALQSPL